LLLENPNGFSAVSPRISRSAGSAVSKYQIVVPVPNLTSTGKGINNPTTTWSSKNKDDEKYFDEGF
jgi:hypothetical protein